MNVTESAPDFTVLADDRLVAYLWRRAEGGHLRRGRSGERPPLLAVPFAEILVFDRRREALLVQLSERAEDLEALLFAVQLEGLQVIAGSVTPHPRQGRF